MEQGLGPARLLPQCRVAGALPLPSPPTRIVPHNCLRPPAQQEPILALRRQLASLSGAAAEAGECWLQLAQLCRSTGHYEAATTAVLEAVASRVPAAPLEHVQLLWDKGQPYRAVSEAQLLAQQAQQRRLAAPFGSEKDHSRFHAQASSWAGACCVQQGLGLRQLLTSVASSLSNRVQQLPCCPGHPLPGLSCRWRCSWRSGWRRRGRRPRMRSRVGAVFWSFSS